MKAWVIDSQSNSGPDYCYRIISVVIAPDDRSANELYMGDEYYPPENKYLQMKTEDLAVLIWDVDPDQYYSGAGWDTQCNSVRTYSNVPSNEASIKRFEIQIEGLEFIEFYKATKKILLDLDQYYKEKIGQDSPYSFKNFMSGFSSFLEDDELPDFLITGISVEFLLDVMEKREII